MVLLLSTLLVTENIVCLLDEDSSFSFLFGVKQSKNKNINIMNTIIIAGEPIKMNIKREPL
jgi:hypothetical protein